jgi:error-prone DNA polymerase
MQEIGRYAELHCKTNFSFLQGASHPDELVARAAELGYAALAITDRHSLAGVVQAHAAARQVGLKLLIGAEILPLDASPVVLLATNRAAYGRLARLLTLGRRRAPKGECHLTLADLAEHAAGLIALCQLPGDTNNRLLSLEESLARYREAFGDRCYALAELHRGADDARQLDLMIRQAREARLPLVAGNDVHYHHRARRALQDVLTSIAAGCTVAEAGQRLFANAERHLKSPEEISALFVRVPEALERSVAIAAQCEFSLAELRYEYPEELAPAGVHPLAYLRQLTWQGAGQRYPAGVPPKVRELVEHELALIEELRYEAYFLTVWDLVRFARGRGILCQGRGSAANSAVCYCLGVTAVDPDRVDVLFERFISRERNEAPDVDLDFEHERREEVLQYLYDKYGRDRAGMTAEVITYRPRSAVRDVGKALGLSLDRVDALSKTLDGYHHEADWESRCREAGLDVDVRVVRQLISLVGELIGFPRHLSQHVGGMVITRGLLSELVPIENAAMTDRTVIQWDKEDLDELGILKVDCLALGMLTAIRKGFDLVQLHYGRELALASIPADDEAVYDMVCEADTVGVFQIESRAQMSMLPRLRPRSFYDLVIEVSLVRPGPIQGDMVHPYLRRRDGLEPIEYPNEAVRQVLEKTLGVPIFQEQAMRLAVVAAGFTPGEADQLRRAMGAWRRPGIIEMFQRKLIDGMQANGLTAEYAQRVFQQICGFGEYGFPESHAASFALLVYVSAWLKRHYPDAFCAALLNSQPMGFYAPAQLVRDAREHGVEVRPADVNSSDWDCTLEHAEGTSLRAVRLGLRTLTGLPMAMMEKILAARERGPFRSLAEFARRTGLSQALLVRLAKADAFGSLELNRRHGLWLALAEQPEKNRPLLAGLDDAEGEEVSMALPELTKYEEVLADYRAQGLSLRDHPLSFFRASLNPLGIARAEQLSELPVGKRARVAGLVLMRQRPSTARGITFITLEDETGIANLIVRPPVWQRYRRVAAGAGAMIAEGILERQGRVIHILTEKLEDLAIHVRSQSRDFR